MSESNLILLTVSVASFIAGYLFAKWNKNHTRTTEPPKSENTPKNTTSLPVVDSSSDEEEDSDDITNQKTKKKPHYKLILVARQDLNMTKGKVAAQVAHAALGAYKVACKAAPDKVKEWSRGGQAKVVVKANSEQELLDIEKKADDSGVTSYLVMDAGRTQVEPGSKTVLAIGPDLDENVDSLTGHLKLL